MTWHPLHVTATSEDWKWWPLVDGVRILMELFRSEKAWLHIYHPRKKLKNAKGVTIFFSYTLKNTFLEKGLATLGWDHIKPPIKLKAQARWWGLSSPEIDTSMAATVVACEWGCGVVFFGVDDCWVSRDLKNLVKHLWCANFSNSETKLHPKRDLSKQWYKYRQVYIHIYICIYVCVHTYIKWISYLYIKPKLYNNII